MSFEGGATKIRVLASFHSPFVHGNGAEIWGGERAFIELVKHLRGHVEVDVVERAPSVLRTALEVEGVRVYEVAARSQFEWLIRALLLLWTLSKPGYDFLYAYNHNLANAVFVYIGSKIMRTPSVINVFHIERYQTRNFIDGYGVARGLYSFSIKNALLVSLLWKIVYKALRRADIIISPSESTTRDIMSLGIRRDKIYTIPLGIEHEKPAYAPKDLVNKDLDCIYVGRLSSNKGIYEALLAWFLVTKKIPNAKMAIVDGEVSRDLSEFVSRKGLTNTVLFYGHLSRRELSETLYRSKLLVLPSHTEGFCFTLGMGILHHVPCVAYDIPVVREVYGFLDSVKLVVEGDVGALSKTILEMLPDEKRPFNKGDLENDRIKLLNRYSWHTTANSTTRLLSVIRARES